MTLSGHLPVTMMRESDLIMSVRRFLTALAASVLVCGIVIPAQAQNASSKASKGAAKPAPSKPDAAKPEAKPAAAVAGNAEPTLIGQFGTWGAYTAAPNGKKVCFALAKPSSSKTNPPNRPRDPAYAFVSTRPSEKVINEVSIMIGYALKPGSESTLEVGGGAYAMYTQGDGLWIKNAAEEERMVDAMRKAADAVVKGVSAKGTETTDTFSLKGLSQALDRLAQDCRR
jgi:invasion associated locus B (IalB) protein